MKSLILFQKRPYSDNSGIFFNYYLLAVFFLTKLITLLNEKPHHVPEKTSFG